MLAATPKSQVTICNEKYHVDQGSLILSASDLFFLLKNNFDKDLIFLVTRFRITACAAARPPSLQSISVASSNRHEFKLTAAFPATPAATAVESLNSETQKYPRTICQPWYDVQNVLSQNR